MTGYIPDGDLAASMSSLQPPEADAADLFPPPFPDREHHSDPCPGCGHVLGVHGDSFGCIHGWTYDVEGHALTDGCDCPLALASEHRPPNERDL